ncbi:MAG: SPOR domain-containing protein [Caldimonas sp.]
MFKQKSDSAATALSPADAVQQARTRARQRLIGAVVLLGIGVIGFPLVFETQPRPIPVDIPIEIPRKDTAPPLVAPPAPVAPLASTRDDDKAKPVEAPKERVVTESRNDAGRDVTPPRAASSVALPSPVRASNSVAAPVPASTPSALPIAPAVESPRRATAVAPASASSAKPATAPNAESERARALLEGRPVAAAETQRFVVQVGAFADAESARETRQKVEKLGLKTYTQVAQTPGGNRIRVRVGPFASREEADAALAKAKAAGLAAVVLTL